MLKSNLITKNEKTRLHNLSIPVIGLTGGISTGKSTVAAFFRRDGYCVIDADKLVKDVYASSEALDFLKSEFPTVVENGAINFRSLRELVFSSSFIQNRVEVFIYERLPKAFLTELKKFNNPEVVIYDVPLLFEKKLDRLVDQTICVYADLETQISRVIQRDKISHELAKNIISKQMSIEEKRTLSNWTIDNSQGLEHVEENYKNFINEAMK